MKWYNIELKANNADKLSTYLKSQNIYYEKSDCGFGYRHMEIKCSVEQMEAINNWLDNNIK